MAITQLSVFAQNKPGGIVEITQLLGNANVNIRALSLADTSDYGILRLIVDSVEQAKETLSSAGYIFQLSPVIGVEMSDTPGGLSHTLSVLHENGVNIEYMYAFIARKKDNAYIILRAEDCEAAEAVLKEAGAYVLSSADVENLH